MQLLIIFVIPCMSKNRRLVSNCGFFYIKREQFQGFSRFAKHDEDFEVLQIWQNVASHVYGFVL